MMNTLMISPPPSSFISHQTQRPRWWYYYFHSTTTITTRRTNYNYNYNYNKLLLLSLPRSATSDEQRQLHTPTTETLLVGDDDDDDMEEVDNSSTSSKQLKKVAQKTAATFAPRASTASKNPAVPGSALYSLFEVQAYASMLFGGALSFNLIFPSNEPDLWRLMGMWSIWMFTIPSLRARDCSKNEKEALNYLFLLIPILNVAIPFFFKSFPLVWSADIIAFFAIYAWKFGWLHTTD